MKELVRRIMTQLEHLKQRFPEAAAASESDFTLNAGATEADFARLEAVLGYALPEEFKELYRAANGESGAGSLWPDDEWLPIERIIEEYGDWKTLLDDGMFADDDGTPYDCEPEDAAIKGDLWWNPKWIPLTADGSGNGKDGERCRTAESREAGCRIMAGYGSFRGGSPERCGHGRHGLHPPGRYSEEFPS